MQENSKGLEALCVESARVGSTCYGDVYRANLTVGEENGTYDITRISLPFTEEKLREIHAHYPGCTEDELDRFCADFTKRVRASAEASQELQNRGSRFVLPNQAVQGERSADGKSYNLYIVSKPFIPLSKAIKIEPGDTTLLSNVLLALEHLCHISLDLNDIGYHAGAYDVDELRCFLDKGKGVVYIGNMLFCSKELDYSAPPIYLPHTAPSIRSGATPSLLTDIYSVFSIGWAVLSGQYYRDFPDFNRIPEVNPELIDLMRHALNYKAIAESGEKPENAVKNIIKRLHAFTKEIKSKGESENIKIEILSRDTAINYPAWLTDTMASGDLPSALEGTTDGSEAHEDSKGEETRKSKKNSQKVAKKPIDEELDGNGEKSSSKKKIIFIALAAVLLLFAVFGGKLIADEIGRASTTTPTEPIEPSEPTDPIDAEAVLIESITVDKTEVKLQPGETATISATALPNNATNRTLAWSSSDIQICEVTDGVVTAINPGYCTVHVHAADGNAEAQVFVEVERPLVALEKLEFLADSLELNEGDVRAIELQVIPDNADGVNLTWSSGDETVAKVSYGTITAIGTGETQIAVTDAETGISATIALIVSSVNPEDETIHISGITLDHSEMTMTPGDRALINATVTPENASLDTVVWLTSNSRVATVINGEVKAVSTGTAEITAKTVDGGFEAKCTVIVQAPEPEPQPQPTPRPTPTPTPQPTPQPTTISVTKVKLSASAITLNTGEKSTLRAEFSPSNATNTGVSWNSSNTKVATVENGTITAVGAGKAVVTVTTADGGHKATCSVTVVEPTVSVTGVTLSRSEVSLSAGNTTQLAPMFAPADATNKAVTWTSSNNSVATVSANGEIKAVSAGTAIITVTTADGGHSATCVVSVIDESQMPGGTSEEGSGDGEGREMDGSNEDVSGTDYGGGESTIVQPNP